MSTSQHSSVAAAPAHAAFDTSPVSDRFGVEITGIDLRDPLDAAARSAIEQAFVEQHVLVFRDQDLDAQQQFDFSLNFGGLENHVIRNRDGARTPLVVGPSGGGKSSVVKAGVIPDRLPGHSANSVPTCD